MTSDEKPVPQAAPRRKLDRYELIAQIARGGMGSVMLARVEGAGGFQRFFAIKMMHPHLAEDRQFISMLLDEARLAARIHHPNVVATVDVCESKLGYYLVMDYIEGFTLAHLLAHPTLDARNRIRLTNRILLDAMAGLDAAHNLRNDEGEALGIVHRDVSPQNILIGLDGVARITDFGVALAASRITSSRPGMIKGKPAYMAPEQARGDALDRRTDLFALGVILWETLTNARLFVADTDAGTVYKVIHGEVATPSEAAPDAPKELEPVCMKALERDRDKRHRSAREMAAALEDAAENADLLAPTHEVADMLQDLFAKEIAERRASIREHLATLAPGTAPIVASDVFDMPRLRQHEPGVPAVSDAAGPGWHETPDGEAFAPTQSVQTPAARSSLVGTVSARGLSPAPGVPRSATGQRSTGSRADAAGPGGTGTRSGGEGPGGRVLTKKAYLIWAASVLLAMAVTVWVVAQLADTDRTDVRTTVGEPPARMEPVREAPALPAVREPAPPAAVVAPPLPGPAGEPPPGPSGDAPPPATSTVPAAGVPAPRAPGHHAGRPPRGPNPNLDPQVEQNPYLHH